MIPRKWKTGKDRQGSTNPYKKPGRVVFPETRLRMIEQDRVPQNCL